MDDPKQEFEWEDEFGTFITYGESYSVSNEQQFNRVDALYKVAEEVSGKQYKRRTIGFF